MFQNMGPAPSSRSGHAMASVGTRVFVLGGESMTTKSEDPNMLHVLDTSTFTYMRADELILSDKQNISSIPTPTRDLRPRVKSLRPASDLQWCLRHSRCINCNNSNSNSPYRMAHDQFRREA